MEENAVGFVLTQRGCMVKSTYEALEIRDRHLANQRMASSAVTASTSTKLSGANVAIESSSAAGRGLCATQDIAAGSLIVRLDPLLSVLDDALIDKTCSACFAPSKAVDNVAGKNLLRCTGCQVMWYCSKANRLPSPTLLLHIG